MKKISETEYVVSYNELMKIINNGYYVVADLRIALEEKLIIDNGKCIRIYMDSKDKKIDIFGTVSCKNEFRRQIYYFIDRSEVFPDEEHPNCFGYIVSAE